MVLQTIIHLYKTRKEKRVVIVTPCHEALWWTRPITLIYSKTASAPEAVHFTRAVSIKQGRV